LAVALVLGLVGALLALALGVAAYARMRPTPTLVRTWAGIGLLELVGAVVLIGLAIVPGKIREYRDHRDQHAARRALAGATGSTASGWKVSLARSGSGDGLRLLIAGPRLVDNSSEVACSTGSYLILFDPGPSTSHSVAFVSDDGLRRTTGFPAGPTCLFWIYACDSHTPVYVPITLAG
jgi:hypothetical protein